MPTAAPPPAGSTGRPELAQELLGWQLRHLRESRGISREAAGRCIDGSESKISRLELGDNKVKEADLDRLLTLYGVAEPEDRHAMLELAGRLHPHQWWDRYTDVLTGWFRSYLVLESIAEYIRTYEVRFIPGLLQTKAYANALIHLHYSDADEVRQRVDVRLQRRHTVLGPGQPPRAHYGRSPKLWAIVDESALHERIGPADVMREQINFLLYALRQGNVMIQILPSGTGGHTGVATSFSILRLRIKSLADVVYLEQIANAQFVHEPHEVEPYEIAFNRLGITALQPRDTITELEKAKRRLRLA